jgi:hypothetical protein
MKTIEEATREYLSKCPYGVWRDNAYTTFKEGIAFAEEWISFEDEIPEAKKTAYQVFVKKDRGTASYYGVETIMPNSEYKSRFYTHWRPINRYNG